MQSKFKLVGYYNYTVILTYIGMITGFSGIILAFGKDPKSAVICLMIAGFCDMFDGAIASTRPRTEQEKCFGIQIDSLSDLICFGVLPASITCSLNNSSLTVIAISAFYVLCALIRLAYFNVDEQERQKVSTESRELYLGMPVTLAALILPFAYGLICLCVPGTWWILAVVLLVMAVLFVLPIPLKKPGIKGKIGCVALGVIDLFLVLFS